MKKIIKILSVLMCAVMLSVTLSACRGSDKELDFIYPFDADIVSFDPQIASKGDEFLIIENCFEGLVRVLDDGTVKPACAESWEISDDGLVYTFHLKEGLVWNFSNELDSEKLPKDSRADLVGLEFDPSLTAKDFVFGLRRAVLPETDAPLFSSVSSIENANEIHAGSENASSLGVTAIDDYTLEIRLVTPDESFLNTLSTAVAMPCNEEFFNATKGRYGLTADYTLFNGQFYVKAILEASYVLDRNELYKGINETKVDNITLSIKNEETDVAKHLSSGLYDCAYITGSQYEQLANSKITAIPYSNTMWAFVFNKNGQLFANEKLREAVCLGTSDIDLSDHAFLENATNFAPPSCLIGSTPAPEAMGATVISADSEKAQELWREGLEETGFTTADITVICPEDMEESCKALVQGIQASVGQITGYGKESTVSFSLKINALPPEEFSTAIAKGEYDIALEPFTSSSQSTVSYLSNIIGGNYLGANDDAEEALIKAQSAGADELAQRCAECEEAIMADYSVLPVLFESSYYAEAKGVSGVNFHPGSGRVCFVYAQRED